MATPGEAGAVLTGGLAAKLAKDFVKAAGGIEAGFEGDVDDFHIGHHEEALGVGDAVAGEIVEQADVIGFAEAGHGIVGMQADGMGDAGDGEGFGVVQGDEAGHVFGFGGGEVRGRVDGQRSGEREAAETGLKLQQDDVLVTGGVTVKVRRPTVEDGGIEEVAGG